MLKNLNFNISKPFLAASHDLVMAAFSFILALYLRLGDEFFIKAEHIIIPGSLLFTGICFLVFTYMRLYQGVWRYASIHDLVTMTKAVTLAIFIFLPVMFLYNRLEAVPRSVFIINWFILLALLGGPRFLFRMLKRNSIFPDFSKVEKKKISVLLVGVNDHTEMFLRDVVGQAESEYEIVGLLDDDPNKIGRRIYNVEIYDRTSAVVEVVEKLKRKGNAPQKILFAPGYVESETVKKLLEQSDEMGLTIARIPRLTDFKSNIEDKKELQQIAVEDLLGRPQAALDRKTIKKFVHRKRVLITGAGGTIGSELVRQVAGYFPAHITLLENAEHNLYLIDKELEEAHPEISRAAVIGDVRDKKKLDLTFSKYTPDVVFHAAALKHVPLSEENVEEAALTNIVGSKNVADACLEADVKGMIMISTDKAVNPTNVMGATKRAAEHYVQTLGRSKKAKNTSFITVRFGNVLGSTGSVVPLFRRQLEAGGPLTVTDPNITRYFMTVREAVELVLQASVLGDGDHQSDEEKGAIYVLDMGEPVAIKELAYQMIRLAGLKPDEDIKVEYTGLRAGEKMFEELFYEEEAPKKTKHGSIMLAKAKNTDLKALNKAIDHLYKESIAKNTEKTLEAIKKLAPEFTPD